MTNTTDPRGVDVLTRLMALANYSSNSAAAISGTTVLVICDSVEEIKRLRARVAEQEQRIAELERDAFIDANWPLPCDVMVAPATVITRGCKLSTLVSCIRLRDEARDSAELDHEAAKRFRQDSISAMRAREVG